MSQVVTPVNLGSEFDIGTIQPSKIRLKIGNRLAIAPDGTINVVLSSTIVDRGFLAASIVDLGQDVNDNGVVTVSNVRTDTGWTLNVNTLDYTGTPNRVRITAMVRQNDGGNNTVRASPSLLLQKFIGAVWTTIAYSTTGYIRDTGGHSESSNTIAYIDPAPGLNPRYRLFTAQDGNNGAVTPVTHGHFDCEAIEQITVFAP